jgi:DNA-directed RNA polymerase specialized sigma24 family protein
MTREERHQLEELLEKAIRGDEQAISEVCEFIDKHKRSETMNRLSRAGVVCSLDQAYQEVLVTVQHKLYQLRVVDAFESWLWRLEMSVAAKLRPRYAQYARSIRVESQASGQPREIGTRIIVVEGKPQIVRIFESLAPEEQPSQRRPLFEPVSDRILANASISNRPNYPSKIDLWKAIAKLPLRWALAILLVYVLGLSAAEAAQIMGCSRTRILKLVQKGKVRMREFLPGYGQNGKAISEPRFETGNRARTKGGLQVSDVLSHGIPIRIGRPLRSRLDGLRCTAQAAHEMQMPS